jgi:transposase
MAAESLSMRTIREVLRLKVEKKLSNKKIAESCNIVRSTVRDYLFRAEQSGVTWPLPADWYDSILEQHVFPTDSVPLAGQRGMPSPEYIRKELTRKSVTLRLLWLEPRASSHL